MKPKVGPSPWTKEHFETVFWSRVAVSDGGCWIWSGRVNEKGYGLAIRHRKHERAHRISYELKKGPIPENLMVLHKCDLPSCVNPDHLFLGTALDNTTDAVIKGRISHGVEHYKAKLNPDKIREIRKIRNSKSMSQNETAKLFGISRGTLLKIERGQTWKHVQ